MMRLRDGRDWIRQNLYLYWLQIYEPYQYKDISDHTIREVYIGNLKAENGRLGGRWFQPRNYKEFKNYAFKQLDKYEVNFPGVYISQERYRGSFIEVRDFYIDLDFDENNPEQSFKAVKYLDEKLNKLGVHILWSLSGNGLHGRLDMLPIYNLFDDDKVLNNFLRDSPRIYSDFIKYLEEYLGIKDYQVKFDRRIYGSRRLIRALYSPHETRMTIEKPIDFNLSLESNQILSRVKHVNNIGRFLGYVEEPKQFLNMLLDIHKLYEEKDESIEKIRLKPFKTHGIRPEVKLLIEKAKAGVHLEHLERLAILFELINNGYGDEDILKVFENQDDYNPKLTLYMIRHARSRGYKPFRRERLQEILSRYRGVEARE